MLNALRRLYPHRVLRGIWDTFLRKHWHTKDVLFGKVRAWYRRRICWACCVAQKQRAPYAVETKTAASDFEECNREYFAGRFKTACAADGFLVATEYTNRRTDQRTAKIESAL